MINRWWYGAAFAASAWMCACSSDADGIAGGGTTASSSGSGGASSGVGGSGGATTAAGSGGAGGQAPTCLDAAAFSGTFALKDDSLCVVGVHEAAVGLGYDATAMFAREPSWGRHGGPVTISPGAAGDVTVDRWSVPADAMGPLTSQSATVSAMIPAGAFLGAQAVDLPFFGWTLLSFTGAYPMTQGKAILINGDAVAASYDVNGLYAGTGVGTAGAGRLLYTGLSMLEDASSNKNALYAADSCGTAGAMPRLLPAGDGSCGAPIEVAAFGDASGPVAVDEKGDVFVAMSSFDNTQEIRGFSAQSVSRGAKAVAGDALFKLPGFGSSLAALAPTATKPGIVAFQPSDGMTYAALDVVAQHFTVDGAGVHPSDPVDAPKALLTLAQAGTALALFTDDNGRLWVGAPKAGGGTTFFVIARRP